MFKKYQHVERFGTSAVNGINKGYCYVFPKLDGTNASVWWDEEAGCVKAGSRNRELTLEADNAGFYRSVLENDELCRMAKDFPHLIFYGEWLVPHTLKTYIFDAWKQFYIFDVVDRDDDSYLEYPNYANLVESYGIRAIPPIWHGVDPDYLKLKELMEANTWLVAEGVGEGIVVKNYNYKNQWGNTIWAKLIAENFKEAKVEKCQQKFNDDVLEEKIVNKYVTEHVVYKVIAKIENEGGFTGKHIPRLLNTCWNDLITEEMWNILKEFKNPTIDFRLLQNLTTAKIKKLCPHIFGH